MSRLIHARMFVKDSAGRVVCRREGVWSSKFDACQGCGTTERPHEARGYCHPCYVKWRYATNMNGVADRIKARQKARRMTEEGEARERAHAEARKLKPEYWEQRRIVANRYSDKVSKWPLGSRVETAMGNLAYWSPTGKAPRFPVEGGIALKGEIVAKTNTRALVRFATFEEWAPYARLRKIEEAAS